MPEKPFQTALFYLVSDCLRCIIARFKIDNKHTGTAMTESITRDSMQYDVVIVGAGPSGLSAAIYDDRQNSFHQAQFYHQKPHQLQGLSES